MARGRVRANSLKMIVVIVAAVVVVVVLVVFVVLLLLLLLNINSSKEILLLRPLVHGPPPKPRPQPRFHHFCEEVSVKTMCTRSGCFVVPCFPLQKTI